MPWLVEAADKSKRKTPLPLHVLAALGKIGPEARAAVPLLEAIVLDGSEQRHLRVHALQALARVDPSSKQFAHPPEGNGEWPGLPTRAHLRPGQ